MEGGLRASPKTVPASPKPMVRVESLWESALSRHPSLKSMLPGSLMSVSDREESTSMFNSGGGSQTKWIRELSSLSNVVVGRCARILMLSTDELKKAFEDEAPPAAREPSRYARNLLEYCCLKALAVATQVSDHLREKDFRRYTFDMMLAWEAPGATSQPAAKVDVESSVGLDAFVKLAPAIPVAADYVTVHRLFEALVEPTNSRLTFAGWEKYLVELDKSIKSIRAQTTPATTSLLNLNKGGESVIEIDGSTTQPVLQHVGVTGWPGRLTLTDHALYFESGVVAYDTAKKFDLSADARHSVKADFTGPWGARLFDKAVAYKSTATPEPVVLEFPELMGHARRDFWLAIIREVISVHNFIRSMRLEGSARAQALARSILGIARLKAIRAVRALPARPESLLTFVSTDELPGGDKILKALAETLRTGDSGAVAGPSGSPVADRESATVTEPSPSHSPQLHSRSASMSEPRRSSVTGTGVAAAAASIVSLLPTSSPRSSWTGSLDGGGPGRAVELQGLPVGEALVGEMTPLERAVASARDNSKKVERARATVDDAKVEGINLNFAVLKELVVPVMSFCAWMQSLLNWEEPSKTMLFLAVSTYVIYRDWLGYVVPVLMLAGIGLTLWLRLLRRWDKRPVEANGNEVTVQKPKPETAVEQFMALQVALAQVEVAIQEANIVLLKSRALVLSELPQATDELLLGLTLLAVGLLLLPFRVLVLIVVWENFTRQLEIRKESTRRILRRLKEWWYRIPVVPVKFVDKNKRD